MRYEKSALISDCGKFRYNLFRQWDFSLPLPGRIKPTTSGHFAVRNKETVMKICTLCGQSGHFAHACPWLSLRYFMSGAFASNSVLRPLSAVEPRQMGISTMRVSSRVEPSNRKFPKEAVMKKPKGWLVKELCEVLECLGSGSYRDAILAMPHANPRSIKYCCSSALAYGLLCIKDDSVRPRKYAVMSCWRTRLSKRLGGPLQPRKDRTHKRLLLEDVWKAM